MDLKQIRYFLVVCEKRSFSRASEALDISQPSLSRQIQMLESELRHHLVRRTGRGVEPTEAGLRFLEHAKAIDRLATLARQDMISFTAPVPSKLRLGMPPRVARRLAPAVVQMFRSRFPQASISIAEGLSSEMHDWLTRDRVDLALLYDPPPSSLLSYESVYREDLVLAYGPNSRPKPPASVKAADLGRYPLVLPSAPNSIRSLVDRITRELNIALNVVAEVDVVHTTLETMQGDDMYTIIPRSALNDVPEEAALRHSTIVAPTIENNLMLAMPVNGPASSLAADTADIIRGLDMAGYFARVAAA